MNKKLFALLVFVAMFSGLVGGMLSGRFAVADAPKTVSAQEYVLNDKDGNLVGSWSAGKNGTTLILYGGGLLGKHQVRPLHNHRP